MARELQAGSVWVNSHFFLSAKVPFGGLKNSGIGMEWGVVGLKQWCNTHLRMKLSCKSHLIGVRSGLGYDWVYM